MGINIPVHKHFEAHYLYLVYIVFENDFLPQLHGKTSGTKTQYIENTNLCVSACVCASGWCVPVHIHN